MYEKLRFSEFISFLYFHDFLKNSNLFWVAQIFESLQGKSEVPGKFRGIFKFCWKALFPANFF